MGVFTKVVGEPWELCPQKKSSLLESWIGGIGAPPQGEPPGIGPQAFGTPGKVVVVVVVVGTVGTTVVPDEVEGLVTVTLGLLAKLGWLRVSTVLNAIAPTPNSFRYEVDFMVILRKLSV